MLDAAAMLDRLRAYPRSLAVLAGLASATGFAPLGLWPATLIALALLVWLIAQAENGRRSFLLGWLFGIAHFALGLNWIATAFTFQAAMPAWLGWIAVLGLACYLAVYPALASWFAWQITVGRASLGRNAPAGPQKGQGLILALAFGGAWIVAEWLRSWVMTGFAWNPLSAILMDKHGHMAGLAASILPWIGTYGLSGMLAFFAALIGALGRATPAHPAAPGAQLRTHLLWGAAIAGVTAVMLLEQAELRGAPRIEPAPGIAISVVQPNVGQQDKWSGSAADANFAKLANPTLDAGVRRPDRAPQAVQNREPRIIFWPEAAIPDYLESGYPPGYYGLGPAAARARLASLLGPDDRLVLGALALHFDGGRQPVAAANSVMIIDGAGQLAHQSGGSPRYDKAHLVPGGEYLPLRSVLAPLGLDRLAPGDLEFRPGPGARTLSLAIPPMPGEAASPPVAWPRMGVQICYEIIFSGKVVDRADRPDFIFNPSNDAWFGSWGPPQHLAQARLRAIEEALPVVRSTPTGISAVIAADGRIIGALPMGSPGRIDARMPAARDPTFFSRHGNAIPLMLAGLMLLFAIALGRRSRYVAART